MGRPPCCDKVGIKKGPWTPEEDIILVSYIQEHGPGNWRSVPTNTGLSRCSKSCRLRWTNYLRPGIKRGNFTPHEEGMIIHLQALLGNKWAAISSYLPQRTDNDIKNYWNTHLKKKLKKFQSSIEPDSTNYLPRSFSDRSLDISSSSNINNNHASSMTQNSQSSTTYASSTENISRLLEGWMRSSPSKNPQLKGTTTTTRDHHDEEEEEKEEIQGNGNHDHKLKQDMMSHEEFDSILSFENLNNNNAAWDKSTCDSMPEKTTYFEGASVSDSKINNRQKHHEINVVNSAAPPPLSYLEKWLLDENVGQVEEMMEMSPMF